MRWDAGNPLHVVVVRNSVAWKSPSRRNLTFAMFICKAYFGGLTVHGTDESLSAHAVLKETIVLSSARERTLDGSGRLEPCFQPESKEEL